MKSKITDFKRAESDQVLDAKNTPFLICGVKQGVRLKTKRHWDREESIEGATS
jgi:hypothetical protein